MIKLFIGVLVVAELAMLAGKVGGNFEPGGLIAPTAPIDAKWARAMARKAEQEARDDAASSSRRRALNACLGPNRESFSPTLYETKVKACEARMAGAAQAPSDEPPPFEYPKPPPEAAKAEAPSGIAPAG